MYETFFDMEHTPFVRDVPPEKLYESNAETEWKSIHDTGTDRLKGRLKFCQPAEGSV